MTKKLMALAALTACAALAQTVTAVQDGAAYTNNVALGSVFVVKGTGLSAAGVVAASAPAYPTTLNNVRISLTATSNGAVVQALMVYTYNQGGVNQLAAVLPSNAAAGTYSLRVTNGATTSAPFSMTVVRNKPGIVTASSDGVGEAQATIGGGLILVRKSNMGRLDRFDTRPVKAGERVDLWGTGLGPDTASDTGGSQGDQTSANAIRVILDGVEIVPLYAGRSSGFPGLDQIVFNVPANVTLSCTNQLRIRANGVLSNQVTIATGTGDNCGPTNPGGGGGGGTTGPLTQSQIDAIIARGVYRQGAISIVRTSGSITAAGQTQALNFDAASASFTAMRGANLRQAFNAGSLPNGYTAPAPGVCNVFVDVTSLPTSSDGLSVQTLDAGPSLSLQGPVSRTLAKQVSVGSISYSTQSANSTNDSWLVPGTYTISGTGGADIGAFSISGSLAPALNWTNRASTNIVNRSSGVTVNWTGGDPSQLMVIMGYSLIASTNGVARGGYFQCFANQSTGSFTVPGSILSRLPPTEETVIPGFGSLVVLPGQILLTSPGTPVFASASGVDLLTLTPASVVMGSVTFR
jgi:uncharacterized protein (TIGR03437 family)